MSEIEEIRKDMEMSLGEITDTQNEMLADFYCWTYMLGHENEGNKKLTKHEMELKNRADRLTDFEKKVCARMTFELRGHEVRALEFVYLFHLIRVSGNKIKQFKEIWKGSHKIFKSKTRFLLKEYGLI